VTHKRERSASAGPTPPKRWAGTGKPSRGTDPASAGKPTRNSKSRALEIKRRIQKGQYPVEDKLDQAIDRLLEKEDL
jgi:hypothetical protein